MLLPIEREREVEALGIVVPQAHRISERRIERDPIDERHVPRLPAGENTTPRPRRSKGLASETNGAVVRHYDELTNGLDTGREKPSLRIRTALLQSKPVFRLFQSRAGGKGSTEGPSPLLAHEGQGPCEAHRQQQCMTQGYHRSSLARLGSEGGVK